MALSTASRVQKTPPVAEPKELTSGGKMDSEHRTRRKPPFRLGIYRVQGEPPVIAVADVSGESAPVPSSLEEIMLITDKEIAKNPSSLEKVIRETEPAEYPIEWMSAPFAEWRLTVYPTEIADVYESDWYSETKHSDRLSQAPAASLHHVWRGTGYSKHQLIAKARSELQAKKNGVNAVRIISSKMRGCM